ncbi:hypothetical protein C4M96_03360 [Mycoplasmopsis pullorum]|uniref:single-stranded DNA-binding protein n=1 Tax=Mycoplasmopsis pullorum TaxID=48003 RepID=UPI001117C09C|nr:single-stranded DNA-binding protein [Mycoplasmopsis pullorum]TNK91813.1 hypothetical protein C4M96_03360 [Mycoplasmopsis pullorum]
MNQINLIGTIYSNPQLVSSKNQNKYYKVGIITNDELKRYINIHFSANMSDLASRLNSGTNVYIQGKLITYILKDKKIQSYYVYAEKINLFDSISVQNNLQNSPKQNIQINDIKEILSI